jgi:hypothetical protein
MQLQNYGTMSFFTLLVSDSWQPSSLFSSFLSFGLCSFLQSSANCEDHGFSDEGNLGFLEL